MTIVSMTSTSEPLALAGVTKDWSFKKTLPGLAIRLLQKTWPLYARPRPRHLAIIPVVSSEAWVMYFVYLPSGGLGPHHVFTLERLRSSGFRVLIICASPAPSSIPDQLKRYADALYWKDLSGYDFSAYTLALEEVAAHSPGATLMILNDSMFGPFSDLRTQISNAPWDMTGYTASGSNGNHIQSFAFILKQVDIERLNSVRSVFCKYHAFNNVHQVIRMQELRMAAVAATHMSVGSHFYTDGREIDDPCLRRPFELLQAGFPFLKRSLLGKMREFQDPERVIQYLRSQHHPV